MQKFQLTILTLVIIALTGTAAIAQDKVSPEKEALIKELVQVTGAAKGITESTNIMMSFQQAEAERMINAMIDDDKVFTPAEKAQLKETTIESLKRMTVRLNEFFVKELDLEKAMSEIMIPIYDRNFSEAELRDLIAFHKSTTGQKAIALVPKLMMETMTGVSEKIMPRLQEFLKKTTDEEFAQIKQKFEQDKKAPPKPKAKS